MRDFIVIPTYNERENILRLVPALSETAPEASIVVVDDNSPDGTAEEVRGMQKRYPRLLADDAVRPGRR